MRRETLEQFNRELIEYAGSDPGFDQMVRDLYRVRAQKAQLEEARTVVFSHVKQAYEVGHRVVPGTPYELKQTSPKAGEPYLAVSSADVKKADPAAWRRAQAPTRFVQVKAPAGAAAAVPVLDAPDGSEFMDPVTAVRTHKEHPAWAVLKELRAEEQDLLDRLDKVAADFGWDGGAEDGPLVFADGWSVQLVRTQFSAEKLYAVEPQLFARLAATKTKQAPARVFIGKAGIGEDADADE
ncbi:hypothetical protein PBI_COOPER_62 [Mycobacterium phage Cooper]|uniref:Uncharacterized protein n=1 Tax=Mycobacterium phage Cooper TaxID=373406 RepID=Q1A054_9CAUD|nr:gp62 [Mycobacterium phage Cooper]ABD58179.1 hypothetical protein PBI_COOPER_62 [Mycobacterium phage Cooper]